MTEQKNQPPQNTQYLLTAGTPPAEPPVDPDPCMALEDIGLLREGYRTMRDMCLAVTEAQRALAARTAYLAKLLQKEREKVQRLRERWLESIKSEAEFRAKAAQESKEREALVAHLRLELDAARKPRRKGGRK